MFVKEEFKKVIAFLRRPNERSLKSATLPQKLNLWTTALLLKLLVGFIFVLLIVLLHETAVPLDYKSESSINDHFFVVLLFMVIIIPALEEFVFRFPLKYKRNYLFRLINPLTGGRLKRFWRKHFAFFFYASAILFGLVHTINYNNNSLLFYLLSPIIVGSQMFGGLMYGYVRVKLGYWWGVLLHGTFNLILIMLPLIGGNESVKIDIENEGKIEELRMSELTYRLGKETSYYKLNHLKLVVQENGNGYIDTIRFHEMNIENMPLRNLVDQVGNFPYYRMREDSTVQLFKFKYAYELEDENVLINLSLKTKEPVLLEEIMDIIGETYSISKISIKDSIQLLEHQ